MTAPTMSPRRAWLQKAAGLIAAASATPALLNAQPPAPRSPRMQGLLDQLNQQSNWRSIELRLLRRISLGMNATEAARVKAMGFSAYLEEQLNFTALDDSACEARVHQNYGRMLAYTPRQVSDMYQFTGDFGPLVAGPWASMTMERSVFSTRQLYERMVEFWSDHFHVTLYAFLGGKPFLDRDVIRPNALGKVGDLIRGSMKNPSMLIYLDQTSSTRFGPNENYARELLELHTVGFDGGYTQRDVAELARVLTGWSVDANGNFLYRANNHDFGAKTSFGMSFLARTPIYNGQNGIDEGEAFGEMLVNHPRTKRFISTKLLQWFVRPDPTEAQIQPVINAYTATGGDIKAMLRVVLTPANVAKAPARLKRPSHYVASAMRATSAAALPMENYRTNFSSLLNPVGGMGQPLANWPTPDGYPDRDDFWAGLIVDRWRNIGNVVQTANTAPGWSVVDLASFMTMATPDGVVQQINQRMFGGEMSPELGIEVRAIVAPGVTNSRVLDALRLTVMSPEFNFY